MKTTNRSTGIVQRSHEDNFKSTSRCDSAHMAAHSCLGRRSAFHHRGFEDRDGRWLEVFWTVDHHTGAVTDIFEDTRGLNRR